MSEKKKVIINHVLQYTSSQYISQGLGFFTATLMRYFINPYGMGVWSLMKVILDYASYAYLGITSVLFYKYPYLVGQGENEKAEDIKNTVFSFISVLSIAFAIGLACFALLFRQKLEQAVFVGLLATAALIFLQRVYTYCVVLLRAQKNFTVLSKSVIFDAVINLTLIILLVKKFNLYGLFMAAILMPILNVAYIRRQVSYGFKYRLVLKEVISYLKFSFPLFINDILTSLFSSIDRVMVVSMLGIEHLGFYSIAIMARSYSVGVSKNFVIVIAPHFLEDYGKVKDIRKISKYMTDGSIILSYFMSFLLGAVFIAATPFIFYVLPKFMPGLLAMQIYLIVTFFAALTNIPSYFIVALEKQTRLVPIIGTALLINIVLNYLFIKMGWGINGVALSTAIAAFFSFFTLVAYVLSHFESLSGSIRFFIRLMFPFVYSAAVLYILNSTLKIGNIALSSAIHLCLFSVAFVPLAFYLNKNTRILSHTLAVLTDKIRKRKKDDE